MLCCSSSALPLTETECRLLQHYILVDSCFLQSWMFFFSSSVLLWNISGIWQLCRTLNLYIHATVDWFLNNQQVNNLKQSQLYFHFLSVFISVWSLCSCNADHLVDMRAQLLGLLTGVLSLKVNFEIVWPLRPLSWVDSYIQDQEGHFMLNLLWPCLSD